MAPGLVVVASILLLFGFCLPLNNGGVVQARRLAPGTTKVSNTSHTILKRGEGKPFFYDSASCYQLGGAYYGAKATFSVFALPDLGTHQTSDASITVSKGFPDEWGQREAVNTIKAGWHVHPVLYGDTKTRLYTFWSTIPDDTNNGCYNLGCKYGFIPSDSSPIKPGDILSSVSTDYIQKYITLTIYQDVNTKNWWLYYDDEVHSGLAIGYWPGSLFTSLSRKANIIQFGGTISYTPQTEGPAMGSGHLADEKDKAASFKDMQHMDRSDNFHDCTLEDLHVYSDNDTCYNTNMSIGLDGKLQFYYGGPSGCQ